MSANYINNTGIQENHLHAYCGKPFSSSNWDHEILDPRYSAQQDPDWHTRESPARLLWKTFFQFKLGS
jgi:hypothetical protein